MSSRRPKCSDIPDAAVLDACRAFHGGLTRQTPDEALADRWPVKLIMAKMKRLLDRGLLAFGTSLRTAWVVEGKAGDA